MNLTTTQIDKLGAIWGAIWSQKLSAGCTAAEAAQAAKAAETAAKAEMLGLQLNPLEQGAPWDDA